MESHGTSEINRTSKLARPIRTQSGDPHTEEAMFGDSWDISRVFDPANEKTLVGLP